MGGRITAVGTHDLCVRPRQNHDAVTFDTTVTVTFDTTDAQIVRPYTGLHVLLYYNGRTTVRPYTRYSSRASPHWTIRPIALMAPIPIPSNL